MQSIVEKNSSEATSKTPITGFQQNIVTYTQFANAHADVVNLPEKSRGTLKTYRLSSDAYAWQEYQIIYTNKLYKRCQIAGGLWGEWQKISAV